ncbi:small multi-drug export protein [bacterium]|nr:small multi-drug export protein [bacterium]
MPTALHIPILIAIHFAMGKKLSFPYGLAVGFSVWEIGALVLIVDFTEIPLFRWILTGACDRVGPLRWLHENLDHRESALSKKRFYRWFLHAGQLGILLLVAIPGAGGVTIGTLITHLLHMPKKQSVLIIAAGSVVGCMLFVVGIEGILAMLGF